MEHVATWVATGLAAKALADTLRRRYAFDTPGGLASARRSIETDLAYVVAYAVALVAVLDIGVRAALVVAIVLRIGAIVGDRVLLPGNHAFLELYVAVVCLRLHDAPIALASVLQVMSVSVWLYSVFQKLYQREFFARSYFYFPLHQTRSRLGAWIRRARRAPAFDADYGVIDASADVFCRRLAVLVLLSETVPPVLALATPRTPW